MIYYIVYYIHNVTICTNYLILHQVTYKEIDEMIKTVDKNGDGKINYSEFRVGN